MHSLVNASTLGFDLLRRPGGAEVAAVLRTALGLGAADLPVLADEHRSDAARAIAWARVAEVESTAATMRVAVRDAVQLCADPYEIGTATRLLQHTPIGNLDGLLRCLRHDVLDWTWDTSGDLAVSDEQATRAAAVLGDAVAGAYHSASLPEAAVRRLGADWELGRRRLAPRAPAGAGDEPVRQLLDHLRSLDHAGREDLRRAATRPVGPGPDWADAMHQATWAVHLSGRVRSAAALQLLAVDAFLGAGLDAADAAGGVWNLVSGAVQALVVRDLAADETLTRLVGPSAGLLS